MKANHLTIISIVVTVFLTTCGGFIWWMLSCLNEIHEVDNHCVQLGQKLNDIDSRLARIHEALVMEKSNRKFTFAMNSLTIENERKKAIASLGSEKNLTQQVVILEKDLSKDPLNSNIIYKIGQSYILKSDYTKASEYYKKLLDANDNSVNSQTELREIINALQDYGKILDSQNRFKTK